MSLNLATKGGKHEQRRTETDRLEILRNQAAEVLSQLQSGEISENEAIASLNSLARRHSGVISRLRYLVP